MAMVPPPLGCFFLGSSSPSGGSRMLSFSSPGSTDAGLDCGSSGVTGMQGFLARVRGPFTPSQWMELEHQALIYKHIVANAPVPAGLLVPIRRSLHPPALPLYSGGTLGSSSLGWGSFQLGYSGSADPEPGRCRRTDGKKWRCSRDAVVDQKYCERHINRGRHRSRKHVEGRSSHAEKAMLAISQPGLGVPSGKSSGSHAMAQQPAKSLVTDFSDPSPTQFDRILLDKGNATDQAQDSGNQQYLQSIFQNTKAARSSEETSSQADYATISTGPLMKARRLEIINFDPQQSRSKQTKPNPVHHLFDKDICPDEIQLSISTINNSNLPDNYDRSQIGHGAGHSSNEGNGAQASWIPVSWETSTDGPLGEFFTMTSNTSDDKNKSYPCPLLNVSTDGRTTSPQLHSPTGVLQMTNFTAVSSSTVSSPAGSLCNMLTGNMVNPQTVQTL